MGMALSPREGQQKSYVGKVGIVAGWGAPKLAESMVDTPNYAEVEIEDRKL